MKDELLAPPKLTVRKYSWIVGSVSATAVIVGVVLALLGIIQYSDLGWRTLMIAVFAGGSVWAYSGLMRYAARARPERMPLIHAIVGSVGIVAFYGTFGLMLRSTQFEGTVPSMFWMIPFVLGTTLATAGVARRVGESLHCPRCEYEYAFDTPDDAPAKCPECGTRWIGRLKKGRRVRSVRLIVTGLVIAITGMIVGNPIFYMGTIARHLPTPVLCMAVRASPGSMFGAWDELEHRPLSEKWIRSLGEVAVERHARLSHDYGPGGWFETARAAGKMPRDLEERFYRAAFRAELDVPRGVKVGEEFSAKLRVLHAASGPRAMCMGVIFGGYDLGEGTNRVGRAVKTSWAHELNPETFQGHRDVFTQTLKAEVRGELRVRATYWVVHLPSFRDPLLWQADGAPAPPAGAHGFERVELVETVKVE